MGERGENPENNEQSKSSVDYEAMYREMHPDLVIDKAKAEARAHAEKPKTDDAMLFESKVPLFDKVLVEQPPGADLEMTRYIADIAKTEAARLLEEARADGEAASMDYDLTHGGLQEDNVDKARMMADAANDLQGDAKYWDRQAGFAVDPESIKGDRRLAESARADADRAALRAGILYDNPSALREDDTDRARALAEASDQAETALARRSSEYKQVEQTGDRVSNIMSRRGVELARTDAERKQAEAENAHDLKEGLAREITEGPKA